MNLEKGQTLESVEMVTLTRENLVEYSEASTDTNPIHLDDEVAKAVGLPGVIAHGMLVATWVTERARRFREVELGPGWQASRFQVRFRNMSFPGETIFVGGRVRSVSLEEVVIELQARNGEGELKTTSQIGFTRDPS